MTASELLENLVVWYGHQVPNAVYVDYLNTYIELGKPRFVPMAIHKLLFGKSMSKCFNMEATALGIRTENQYSH